MPEVDWVSLSVGIVAIGGVVFETLLRFRDSRERVEQLRLLARQVVALEGLVEAQGRVVSALADTRKEGSEAWKEEIQRRRKKDEFDQSLLLWKQLLGFLRIR